jgi:hypothetical protein
MLPSHCLVYLCALRTKRDAPVAERGIDVRLEPPVYVQSYA